MRTVLEPREEETAPRSAYIPAITQKEDCKETQKDPSTPQVHAPDGRGTTTTPGRTATVSQTRKGSVNQRR